MNKEQIKEKIESLKIDIMRQQNIIDRIASLNPNNGNLSFDYYQLNLMEDEYKELEKQLEEIEAKE